MPATRKLCERAFTLFGDALGVAELTDRAGHPARARPVTLHLQAHLPVGKASSGTTRCVAVDMGAAVEKNHEIHRGHERLHVAQASLFELPFAPASFDLVFCFGVLQHTPSPERSFEALARFVKPGGRLAVDVYAAHPKQTLHWKYLFRPVTRRLPNTTLLRAIEAWVPVLLPLHKRLRAVPRIGKPLSRLLPLMAHDGILGQVPEEQEVDWVVLDTLDALTPRYDRPRSRRAVERWFRDAGFVDLYVTNQNRALNYGWGTRPA